MRLTKTVIHNNALDNELRHVDSTPTSNIQIYADEEKQSSLKDYIKFDISNIDTKLYYNQLVIAGVYAFICLASIISGDILSLITPVFMVSLIIILSSNPIKIENNRVFDIGVWNLIKCFNILIKGFNLSKLSHNYKNITDYFTKLFINSLLLSGYPAFNTFFILITLGLYLSYLLCFINKDLNYIKESGKEIQNKELIFIIMSTIIFALAFKGSVANGTVFTVVILLKYFQESIKELEIKELEIN